MVKRETSAEIDAVACDWAVRIDTAPLDTDEQAELDDWLADDVRRLGAFARARAGLLHARKVQALGSDFDPDRLIEYEAVSSEVEADEPVPLVSRRRLLLVGGSAAACATLGVFGFAWQAAATETFTTRRGEIRRIPLADGSAMTLNTASTARVRFGRSERHVELVEGEALFDVRPDPTRPFIVAAGDTELRGTSTSFAVKHLAGQPVEVVVRQGEVALKRSEAPAAPPKTIAANIHVVAPSSGPVTTASVAPDAVGRSLAWRDGMLSFEDETLDQAAAEFARYSGTPIRFADPSIGRETVTGLFAADNPRGFARALTTSLDLKLEEGPDGLVLKR